MMVDPVEGPGGPAGQDVLTTLPPEVLQNMMEFMAPETLSTLRGTSEELQFQIDDYVEHLINSGELTDWRGNPLMGETGVPEVLQDWVDGEVGLRLQPPSEAEIAAIQGRFDRNFGTYPNDINYQQGLLEGYDTLIGQGGARAQELQDYLRTYIRSLLDEGRLYDVETGDPLPSDTRFAQALELWRSGDARWSPPDGPQ